MAEVQAKSDTWHGRSDEWGLGNATFHRMTVSLAYGGEGLGATWGNQRALSMLADAGFTSVATAQIDSDPLNIYYIARKT